MKIHFAAVMLILLVAATATAAEVDDKDLEKKATKIMEMKCTRCHSRAVINAAVISGRDMNVVVKQMEARGVSLSPKEKEMLFIFWKKTEGPAK